MLAFHFRGKSWNRFQISVNEISNDNCLMPNLKITWKTFKQANCRFTILEAKQITSIILIIWSWNKDRNQLKYVNSKMSMQKRIIKAYQNRSQTLMISVIIKMDGTEIVLHTSHLQLKLETQRWISSFSMRC